MKLLPQYKPLWFKHAKRYTIVTGGRGSGKSWHVAYFLLWLINEPGHVVLFTRYTLVSAGISIMPEFIEKIDLLDKAGEFHITKDEIIHKISGSRIIFKGIKTSSGNQTANLKSIQGVTTFILDEAEELTEYDTFEKIDLSIREKDKMNRVILVMNPSYKTHWIYKDFVSANRDDVTHIHTTYLDNHIHLSESFLAQAERTKTTNPARYRHIFMGEWLDEADGLLWTRPLIERLRVAQAPDARRIIIGVDPAVTSTSESDETGIIVASTDTAGNGYVLEDLSGRYSPAQWGAVVASAFDRWKADAIVAEKNQGGDMVESIIRQHHKTARVKLVTATKGKLVRAEPIYGLYEQGKIYHVGQFPILESQMVTFNPNTGSSPDRVDALVWAFTDLLLKPKKDIEFYFA
jgi:phage terminase large subunit-like protein